MKLSKLAVALGLVSAAALVTTGAATPRTGTRTLATAGSVVALSADGARVAVATAGLAHACDRVVLWNAPARSSARWVAHTNCGGGRQTSGGQRLTELALAGTRALWVESISGNDQELALWSATPGRKPSMLAFATNGNGAGEDPAGDYLGHVHADGTLAAFNTWRVCPRPGSVLLPPVCPPATLSQQTLWRVTPAGKQQIRRTADTTFVAAVDAGRIAVQHASGSVTLFSASGAPLTQVAVPPGRFTGLALNGTQLAVIRDGSLEVYSTATGPLTKRIGLPSTPAPTLRDLDAGLAVYTAGRTVHVVKVATGRNRAWAAPTAALDAQLETAGLWYAYNRASGSSRGRVVFVPRTQVAARLR